MEHTDNPPACQYRTPNTDPRLGPGPSKDWCNKFDNYCWRSPDHHCPPLNHDDALTQLKHYLDTTLAKAQKTTQHLHAHCYPVQDGQLDTQRIQADGQILLIEQLLQLIHKLQKDTPDAHTQLKQLKQLKQITNTIKQITPELAQNGDFITLGELEAALSKAHAIAAVSYDHIATQTETHKDTPMPPSKPISPDHPDHIPTTSEETLRRNCVSTPQPTPARPIPAALTELDNALLNLHNQTTNLQDRLDHVLTPPNPSPTAEETDKPTVGPLTETIHNKTRYIQAITNTIDDILHRLEL